MRGRKVVSVVLMAAAVGCNESTSPDGQRSVAVEFGIANDGANATFSPDLFASITPAADELVIVGSNGTLVIQDIRFIVSELELERVGGEGCGRGRGSNNSGSRGNADCRDIERGPFIVDLPLEGSLTVGAESEIPAGVYEEIEFEIENLRDDNDGDDEKRDDFARVLSRMRQSYPNFPERASMVVKGTFNGQPFTVFFDAEIEIERELNPPLRVPEDGTVRIELNPRAWFKQGNQVVNLRALDGRVVEFHSEFVTAIVRLRVVGQRLE